MMVVCGDGSCGVWLMVVSGILVWKYAGSGVAVMVLYYDSRAQAECGVMCNV